MNPLNPEQHFTRSVRSPIAMMKSNGGDGLTDRNALNSLWGKLASEILMQNWEAAMEDLTRLRETIDNNAAALESYPLSLPTFLPFSSAQSVTSPLQALQQRTWLIHWSLFVFFNHPKGRDNIIELFLYQPQ
ncbi:Eukaryotic translation initiation factor 3 subunit E [Liparis tanakae]|uniref:Eukaryotic translation initiation factor 3 subunit E n=1 Tax=Liparis tanakae TaxID=230148 RepID=A0A4Z2FV83_9TELE|nr:Eukaryotic translation initiation factor 3 subunit E [Liparis tanakae]